MSWSASLTLGIDVSTQNVKLVLIENESRALTFEHTEPLGFENCSLAHKEYLVPVLSWAIALDKALLAAGSARLNRVTSVSGSAQQHGSVYWSQLGQHVLANRAPHQSLADSLFNSDKTPSSSSSSSLSSSSSSSSLHSSSLHSSSLHSSSLHCKRCGCRPASCQLCSSLTLRTPCALLFALAPIWRDSSTERECRALEEAVGGARRLAQLTGSVAHERFTGAQLMKRWPAIDELGCARVSLVSSFAASLLVGRVVPIDWSDGSGMNLLELSTRTWCTYALRGVVGGDRDAAQRLAAMLGEPVAPDTVVGTMSAYACERFGFAPSCRVVAFSGDNPCSVAGLQLRSPCRLAVSLGTSDTLMALLDDDKSKHAAMLEAHMFVDATAPRSRYMALLCYKNGSLNREHFRDAWSLGNDWQHFDEALAATQPGNGGFLGLYYSEPEILPPQALGVYRYAADDAPLAEFASRAIDVRALVESRFMSMRVHARRIGVTAHLSSMVVTGGASASPRIVQVLADVFGVPVYASRTAPGLCAALGACYRALSATSSSSPNDDDDSLLVEIARPQHHGCYGAELLDRFERLESSVVGNKTD
jgi:xylulokinase